MNAKVAERISRKPRLITLRSAITNDDKQGTRYEVNNAIQIFEEIVQ